MRQFLFATISLVVSKQRLPGLRMNPKALNSAGSKRPMTQALSNMNHICVSSLVGFWIKAMKRFGLLGFISHLVHVTNIRQWLIHRWPALHKQKSLVFMTYILLHDTSVGMKFYKLLEFYQSIMLYMENGTLSSNWVPYLLLMNVHSVFWYAASATVSTLFLTVNPWKAFRAEVTMTRGRGRDMEGHG